ncbi:BnaA01g36780D [Brassica napus]|uniref:BnaA01g36780D protein n=1 Tax=Brassica napus TaxID=3708 RepID=A0A078J6P0_BRANA|nr:BnaA01g36780D [Brassica napus]
MEVNIRTTAADYRLTVPVRGELTFHINPVGGLVPQIDRRLYFNEARVYSQAGGGFTIKLNSVGLLVPPQAGGVKEEYESENPKLPYPSPGKANPKARKAWGRRVSHSITKDQSSTICAPII